jgi:hypothetical protein
MSPRNAARPLAVFLLLGAVGTGSAAAVPWPGASVRSAKKAKPCKASELRQTITYTTAGHKHSVTACVPRSWSTRATLSQGRAIAVKLAPKPTARLLRGTAARRVSAADPVLDRAIAATLAAAAPARARVASWPRLHAAEVTHSGGTETLAGPHGTQTTNTGSTTDWSSSEPNPGSDQEGTIDTKGAPVGGLGSSKQTKIRLLRTISRCPDAGGIAHGVIKMSLAESQTIDNPGGGHSVIENTIIYNAELLVHFNDNAAVESVEIVDGNWNWSTEARSSSSAKGVEKRLNRHSVGGSARGSTATDGRNPDINTTVTTATGSGMATYGPLFGAMAHLIVDSVYTELVRDSAGRARSGACARIVPDPLSVHVKPGRSVAITAALNDGTAPLPGTVKAVAQRASVTPDAASADPTARFTYNALSSSPPGKTDTVTLNHVSKRGLANAKTVTVIYDVPPVPAFPKRFDGTWTQTVTNPQRGSWTQTAHGTATYELNASQSDQAHGQYALTSNSVGWTVSGRQDYPDGSSCTFDGSGTDSPAAKNPTQLTLDNVTDDSRAPSPEPKPYYYAIWDYGDENAAPNYHVTCGPGPPYDDTVSTLWLHAGHPAWYSGTQNDIQKSDKPERLEGHRARQSGQLTIDEEWSFVGSG